MDVNNLTSVYNQNPTLQGQYTLPQYLALFGQGATPTTPTPTPTPTATPAPSQGIVNAGINQYQGGGSEGIDMIGGIGAFGNLDPNSLKTVVRDVYNIETGKFEPREIDTYLDKTGARKTLDNKNPTHAGMHGVKGLAGYVMEGLGFGPEKDEKGYTDGMIKGMFTGYTSKGDLSTMQFLKQNKDRREYLKQLEDNLRKEQKEKADAVSRAARAQNISKQQAAQQREAIQRDYRDDRGGDARAYEGSTGGYNEGNFCFDPKTPIQMADGSTKEIKNIQLGDNTKGGEVTGVFQFKASDEIHDYKGVTVAGSHYVKEDGRFIMVKDSPLSIKIDKIPVVYSLDTTGRRIFIKDIEFADYNGDGVAKNFLNNAGVDLTGFDKEVLRQVEHRLI